MCSLNRASFFFFFKQGISEEAQGTPAAGGAEELWSPESSFPLGKQHTRFVTDAFFRASNRDRGTPRLSEKGLASLQEGAQPGRWGLLPREAPGKEQPHPLDTPDRAPGSYSHRALGTGQTQPGGKDTEKKDTAAASV